MSVQPATTAPRLLIAYTFVDTPAAVVWEALDPTNREIGNYGGLDFGIGLTPNPAVQPAGGMARFRQGRDDLSLNAVFATVEGGEVTVAEQHAALRGYVWGLFLNQAP